MPSDRVSVFLPCRKGSVRVPHKNIRPLASYMHGLIEIKLRQLLATTEIAEVVLSTNDGELIDFANSLGAARLRVHRRSESLAGDETSTDALVSHAHELIPDGHILWTHVTSPFLNSEGIASVIRRYFEALTEGYDSLMTVTAVHGFLWNAQGPVNYDRLKEKWPRTQTIQPVFEVNSGAFLSSAENYAVLNDRIGNRPFLYETGKIAGFDIDWEHDFSIAECMIEKGIGKV